MERHKLIVQMHDGEFSNPAGEHILFEKHREEEIDLPDIFDSKHLVRARDMTWPQLVARARAGEAWTREGGSAAGQARSTADWASTPRTSRKSS